MGHWDELGIHAGDDIRAHLLRRSCGVSRGETPCSGSTSNQQLREGRATRAPTLGTRNYTRLQPSLLEYILIVEEIIR